MVNLSSGRVKRGHATWASYNLLFHRLRLIPCLNSLLRILKESAVTIADNNGFPYPTRQFQFSKSPSGTHLAARTTFHIQLPRSRTVFLLESYKVMSSGREEGGERHNQGHMRRLTLPSRSTHLMLWRPSEIASNTIKLTYTTGISHIHRFQNYEENRPNF